MESLETLKILMDLSSNSSALSEQMKYVVKTLEEMRKEGREQHKKTEKHLSDSSVHRCAEHSILISDLVVSVSKLKAVHEHTEGIKKGVVYSWKFLLLVSSACSGAAFYLAKMMFGGG